MVISAELATKPLRALGAVAHMTEHGALPMPRGVATAIRAMSPRPIGVDTTELCMLHLSTVVKTVWTMSLPNQQCRRLKNVHQRLFYPRLRKILIICHRFLFRRLQIHNVRCLEELIKRDKIQQIHIHSILEWGFLPVR